MPLDDESDADAASDIPSFEDLVERLGKSGDSDDEEGKGDDSVASFGDLADSTEEFDSSKWQWGGSDEPEAELSVQPPTEVGEIGEGDLVSDSKTDALIDLLEDASNVLVVGPDATPVEYDLCAKLCTTEHRPRRRLLVTTNQSPDERLNALRGYGASSFDETTVIAVGDQIRSGGDESSTSHELGGETITIETINDQRDLTRLGLLINKHLNEEPDDPPPVVCFHTLTTLLQYVEIEKAFRFLHVLQGRVRTAGARAHYHLDPGPLDDEVLHTLRPVFDFTVRFDADGELAVDT